MNHDNLSPSELAALASQCYGQRWQSALARDIGVAVRTVQRWAARGISKQPLADSVRRFLTDRRVASIPSPPPGLSEDERDDACHDALEPTVAALAAAADDVGWHPAEVWVAILSISAENLAHIGGANAAIKTLEQAISGLRSWRL